MHAKGHKSDLGDYAQSPGLGGGYAVDQPVI